VAQRALDLAEAHRERGHQGWALRLLAAVDAHGAGADMDRAREHYFRALAVAQELGMRPLAALVHLDLGALFRRAGDWERAEEHLATAVRELRSMDMRYWAGQAAAEIKAVGGLVVVSPDEPDLADFLRREFAGSPVSVVVDRRVGPGVPPAGAPSRRRLDVNEALRTRGLVIIPGPAS
jgi:hypothetical protein